MEDEAVSKHNTRCKVHRWLYPNENATGARHKITREKAVTMAMPSNTWLSCTTEEGMAAFTTPMRL